MIEAVQATPTTRRRSRALPERRRAAVPPVAAAKEGAHGGTMGSRHLSGLGRVPSEPSLAWR